MAFAHLAAIREADRIHARRLAKAQALGMTLLEYHERVELRAVPDSPLDQGIERG